MKEWINTRKVWLILYACLLGSALILSFFSLGEITFFLLSVFINTLLIHIIYEVIKLFKIEFTNKEKIIMLSSVLFIYLFFAISLLTRNFIYYWDYAVYYNIQIDTIDQFSKSLFDGIRSFIGSTWSGEYGSFLSFITEMPFQLTNKTPNSYVSSCVFIFAPYLIISLSILIKRLTLLLKIKQSELVFCMTNISFVLFPILHATAIFGQPDYFGLFFIFLIVSLTISYDFKKIDYIRLIILFLVTYMLFISRRWYVYWLIAYYLCYGITIIYKAFKDKKNKKIILRNVFSFAGICGVLFLITLFPLLRNIIINDYSSHYIFYGGGLINELIYQVGHLGLAMTIILVIGIILGFLDKKYMSITINSLLQWLIIVVLFSRIQTMGFHHSLLLLPSCLGILFVFISYLSIGKRKILIYSGLVFIMLLNFTCCVFDLKNIFMSDAKLSVPYQEDYKEIGDVVDWLEDNLDKDHYAYMITHNNKYNPDKFRNYHMPNNYVKYHLPYGSSIIGVHKFPLELFTANYIITTNPFEKTSVDEKYEIVFEKLVSQNKFKLVKDFDMNNGYHTLIYERIVPVDKEEVEEYENALIDESKQFSELYIDILEDFKKGV